MMDRTPCAKCDPRSKDMIVGWLSALRAEDRGPPIMTPDQPRNDVITTDDQFETALAKAVETATEAGVDVSGAWEVQTKGSTHTWDVVITQVVKGRNEELE